MTHKPLIPAGNQSPYPLHEPPHAKAPEQARVSQGRSGGRALSLLPAIVATIGAGAIATVAALWLLPSRADGNSGTRARKKAS